VVTTMIHVNVTTPYGLGSFNEILYV